MAKRKKSEKVYATFHYLVRKIRTDDGALETEGFSERDFDRLIDGLENYPTLDLNDERIRDKLRFKKIVPIEDIQKIDDRTYFGCYRGAYWGHSYDNTAVGKIPADSISLRPFYFILYFSISGKIYIGVQYLAQFGSYDALKRTISDILGNPSLVSAHSFRKDSVDISVLKAKKIIVNISRAPDRLDRRNAYGQKAAIAFTGLQEDQQTQFAIRRKLMPALGTEKKGVQMAIARLLNESELADVSDEEIEGCQLIVEENGRDRTIRFLGGGLYPSQYPLHVDFNDDGHPTAQSACKAMVQSLEENILVVKENA
jgi:hypothetical protein